MSDDIDTLIRALDDDPSMAHLDITPAVERLAEIGLPAAPHLIPLLEAEDPMTRLHASRALEGIIERRFGFRPGRGFPDAAAEESVRRLWRENGDYRSDAPAEARAAATAKWRAWMARER
jgi:HEAT repeat protein